MIELLKDWWIVIVLMVIFVALVSSIVVAQLQKTAEHQSTPQCTSDQMVEVKAYRMECYSMWHTSTEACDEQIEKIQGCLIKTGSNK